jgi:hypothetical protein
MPQDVEEPREIPVMGDLLLSFDPEESMQRGVAADFSEAGVIRGMPQERGEHGNAPEEGDGIVVPPASSSLPQTPQERGVRDGLETSADRPQGGRILQGRPGKQGLSIRDPHRRDGSDDGYRVYIAMNPPCKGAVG